jgi:hypothetical protein
VSTEQAPGDWGGNFDNGDELLTTNCCAGYGPLIFSFSEAVSGLGANIEPQRSDGPFTAVLQGFDSGGHLIDSVTESGEIDTTVGTAIFIGLANDPGIVSAEFSVTSCPLECTAFAVNQLDIVPSETGTVPEPATFPMLLLGIASIGGIQRRWLGGRKG